MKIITWATYKKKFNPKGYYVQDSTLGFVSSIKPTMLSAGFKYTDFELATGSDAKEINGTYKQIINNNMEFFLKNGVTDIVYHVWAHSRGYCKYLEVYYK